MAGGLALAVLPHAAQAETVAAPAIASGFSLASAEARRPDTRFPVRPLPPRSSALPRELPEMRAETVLPTPGFDWRPARGATIRLRPAKLRFNLDF